MGYPIILLFFSLRPPILKLSSFQGSLTINNSTDQSSSSNNNNAMINPHESISIKNRAPVKSIRIERDYSLGDGITRFSTEYPAELSGKVRISIEFRVHCINLFPLDYSRTVSKHYYRD